MRLLFCWLGICFTVIGVLSAIFQHKIPSENNLLNTNESLLLGALGVLLLYVGRKHLSATMAYIFGSEDSADDGEY